MTEPLLTEAESSAALDRDLLDRATFGVVAELVDPDGDSARYRQTVVALAALPSEAMWWVDLVVAAEMLANERVMREPAGFRMSR